MKLALQIILAISLIGAVFSGVLSYREIFAATAAACLAPGAHGTVLGYPACVYGFFMYLTLSGVAAAGLRGAAARRPVPDRGAAPGVSTAS